MVFLVTIQLISCWYACKIAVLFPPTCCARNSDTPFHCKCCLWFMAGQHISDLIHKRFLIYIFYCCLQFSFSEVLPSRSSKRYTYETLLIKIVFVVSYLDRCKVFDVVLCGCNWITLFLYLMLCQPYRRSYLLGSYCIIRWNEKIKLISAPYVGRRTLQQILASLINCLKTEWKWWLEFFFFLEIVLSSIGIKHNVLCALFSQMMFRLSSTYSY